MQVKKEKEPEVPSFKPTITHYLPSVSFDNVGTVKKSKQDTMLGA